VINNLTKGVIYAERRRYHEFKISQAVFGGMGFVFSPSGVLVLRTDSSSGSKATGDADGCKRRR
jgi:hypothetical protein